MCKLELTYGFETLASKQAVAYCWHSPAWLFLVLSPIGTHDHIFVLIYNPYGIRQWASSSVRGGVDLFKCCWPLPVTVSRTAFGLPSSLQRRKTKGSPR
jgi:hypothetical protein